MSDRTIDHGSDDTAMLPEDIGELRQRDDDDYPAVRVRIEGGPLTVHEMPARTAHSRSVTVTDATDPNVLEQLASGDLRIKSITIVCATNPVFIGFDKQGVSSGVCGVLPVGVPLTLSTAAPIWCRSTVVGGSLVSWWAANWAD